MAFKAAGNPISVLREQLTVNAASFTGTGTNPSANDDFWPELCRIDGTQARQTKTHDATDYPAATHPVEDSWEVRLAGGCGTPANVARLNSSANIRGGQQT
jgi:hypothetical protein